MFCPRCGKETAENQVFCSGCGAHLQGPGSTNTSGMGPLAQTPPEIRGWNWGGFFLNWIWGVGNSVWIALLGLIPFVGFVMSFVLGAKGSEWAWAARKWDSVEHFKRIQRRWALIGLIISIVGVVLWALYVLVVVLAVTTSDSPQGVDLRNNESASDPTWDRLLDFLITDPTDEQAYLEGVRVCTDFAEELHNNAEANGIRAGYVEVLFVDSEVGHALNVFETADKGRVFVDCTGPDTGAVMPSQPGGGLDGICDHDSIAYVQLGKEYGLVGVDVAESPTYTFYEDYVRRWEEYENALEEYNAEVSAYDSLYDRCGGIASWGECSALVSMYDALESELVRLEAMSDDLSCIWDSLGTVSDIDIYW